MEGTFDEFAELFVEDNGKTKKNNERQDLE